MRLVASVQRLLEQRKERIMNILSNVLVGSDFIQPEEASGLAQGSCKRSSQWREVHLIVVQTTLQNMTSTNELLNTNSKPDY